MGGEAADSGHYWPQRSRRGAVNPAAGNARQRIRSKTFALMLFPSWRANAVLLTTTRSWSGSRPCRRHFSAKRSVRQRLETQISQRVSKQGHRLCRGRAKAAVFLRSKSQGSLWGFAPRAKEHPNIAAKVFPAFVSGRGCASGSAVSRNSSIPGGGSGSGHWKVPWSTSLRRHTM